jgi:L-iditol 2-dehydrogenase
LRLADVPTPIPGAGEALIRVKCAGICSSDTPRVFTSGAYHYPIILGHEFSGVVERVCDRGDAHLLGKRVGAFPLLPCFKCESCLHGCYETCSDYGYIGSRQDGAFAEFVVVPSWNLIALPDAMGFEQATLIEPAAVALHAVRRFDLRDISGAAVVGTGVIGRLVLVGNPAADFNLPQDIYRKILRKQLSVRGSWNASFPSDWKDVILYAAELGLAKLVSHRYTFGELHRAFATMRDGRKRRGKVLITYDTCLK